MDAGGPLFIDRATDDGGVGDGGLGDGGATDGGAADAGLLRDAGLPPDGGDAVVTFGPGSFTLDGGTGGVGTAAPSLMLSKTRETSGVARISSSGSSR